jgi:hypothetical protein
MKYLRGFKNYISFYYVYASLSLTMLVTVVAPSTEILGSNHAGGMNVSLL